MFSDFKALGVNIRSIEELNRRQCFPKEVDFKILKITDVSRPPSIPNNNNNELLRYDDTSSIMEEDFSESEETLFEKGIFKWELEDNRNEIVNGYILNPWKEERSFKVNDIVRIRIPKVEFNGCFFIEKENII